MPGWRSQARADVYHADRLSNSSPLHHQLSHQTSLENPSRIEDIEIGLQALIESVRWLKIRSIAVPPLGCGNVQSSQQKRWLLLKTLVKTLLLIWDYRISAKIGKMNIGKLTPQLHDGSTHLRPEALTIHDHYSGGLQYTLGSIPLHPEQHTLDFT